MMRLLAFASVAVSSGHPISKVVNLLKDMRSQLEREAEDDQAVYDKLASWCAINDKNKTEAIKDADRTISRLTGEVEELAANSARLSTEIQHLSTEVAENTDALNQADELRQKQLAEFNTEEKDLLQAISSLKAGLTVLSKHHETSLLQASDATMIHVATVLRDNMRRYPNMINSVITPSQKQLINSFIQAPAGFQSYAPQSSQIYGILKQMLANFETNLAGEQKDEKNNQEAFMEFKTAKMDEIQNGQDQIEKKTVRLAETDENLAQDKELIKDTKASLSADEQFLMDLKVKCQMTDQHWEARQKKRQDEIAAVGQALIVLEGGGHANETFSRTFQFVQVSSTRQDAAALLQTVAVKFQNPKLSAIATQIRLDAFTKVKKAIDHMIANLLKEKEDEVKKRDFCIDSLNENERQTTKTTRDHKDVQGRIDKLSGDLEKLAQSIDELNAQVQDLHAQLKLAGEDREIQNKEFQSTVKDQRDTRVLLQQAIKELEVFYSKKFLQQSQAPEGFKDYESNSGGNAVLTLLKKIIADTNAMEAEAQRTEDDAQKAYEGFVAETRRSVNAKTKARVDAEEDKGKKEVERSEAEKHREDLNFQLDSLAGEEADFHTSCDFVVHNFDVRQEARDQEVQALRQAKDILSGSNASFQPSSFLHRS